MLNITSRSREAVAQFARGEDNVALSPDDLRIAVLARIEFGPETKRPISERLAERLPELTHAERVTALDVANHVVTMAVRLVREFRTSTRAEDTITPSLLESFPWLGANAAPVQSLHALPAKDLSSHIRTFAYYLVMK